jgi:hypothetical protein
MRGHRLVEDYSPANGDDDPVVPEAFLEVNLQDLHRSVTRRCGDNPSRAAARGCEHDDPGREHGDHSDRPTAGRTR